MYLRATGGARRGAETMSAVEHKHPGYCVSSKGELRDVDRVPGDEDEGGGAHRAADGRFSYALGARVDASKFTASGCIIEYVKARLLCRLPPG